MLPTMSESAKISNIHYIYQDRPNKQRANKMAKRKLGRLGYELDERNTDADVLTAKKGNNITSIIVEPTLTAQETSYQMRH